MLTEDAIRAALSRIVDPAKGIDIVSADQVKAITIKGGDVSFVLEVDAARGGAMEPLRKAAEAAARLKASQDAARRAAAERAQQIAQARAAQQRRTAAPAARTTPAARPAPAVTPTAVQTAQNIRNSLNQGELSRFLGRGVRV